VQVKPKLPLRPQLPPKELQQLFLTTQRANERKPKSVLQLHLETVQAAEAIHARVKQLRIQTQILCARMQAAQVRYHLIPDTE
jgi:hypothetical protein